MSIPSLSAATSSSRTESSYGELPRRLAELERSSERLHAGFAPASAA
jgi:hypothetical protein